MRKLLTGVAIGLGLALAFDYIAPTQAVVQYVPSAERFDVVTYRAPRNHSYVLPQFTIPLHDGSDEGQCPQYAGHWFGLCVPA